MDNKERALREHMRHNGKIEMMSKVRIDCADDLAVYYTPGVAHVSEAIKQDINTAYDYTSKSNTIAIVTDGTRILGLGDIGPEAGLPVMEGKALLFKRFGGVDAVPICLSTKDEAEIINIIKAIAPTFGGINIEDIKSPKSIRIANKLTTEIDIPVFHDDRQGTAVAALAALINALKVVGKGNGAKVVINGAGAAGIGIAELMHHYGMHNLVVLDTEGAIYKGRRENMNEYKEHLADITNRKLEKGTLMELAKDADALIGVSERGAFTMEMVKSMNPNAIVFSLANPFPEIGYDDAKKAGAAVVATGSSEYPNQVNNVIAFPGIMRGMLDARIKRINNDMLVGAALSIARSTGRITDEHILPSISDRGFEMRIAPSVAGKVAEAAARTGEARIKVTEQQVKKRAKELIRRYKKVERSATKYPYPESTSPLI